MLALRLARSAAFKSAAAQRRCLTTATANHADIVSSSQTATASRVTPIPLSNIEAQWENLSAEEKASVHEKLEVLQQKDWKELSLDEKKACASFLPCWILSLGGGGLRSSPFLSRLNHVYVYLTVNFLFSLAYYVAFGPHGPRTPTSLPGDGLKVFLATMGLVGVSGVIFLFIQSRCMYSRWLGVVSIGADNARIYP